MVEVLPYNDTHLNKFCTGMMLRNETGEGGRGAILYLGKYDTKSVYSYTQKH
jgi:hypothetical protein